MCLARLGTVVGVVAGDPAPLAYVQTPDGRVTVSLLLAPHVRAGDEVVIHAGHVVRASPARPPVTGDPTTRVERNVS